MTNEKFDINQLYKALKQQDIEILKHYNDSSISDSDYFNYAIESDIFSNALNVIVNVLSNNKESSGVDLSCRSIVEALVILEMNKKGDISDIQKKIYRYSYTLVDNSNFGNEIKQMPENIRKKFFKPFKEDKSKVEKAILEHFDRSLHDLNKEKNSYTFDPCFYLKKKIDDDIRFSILLEKYPIGISKDIYDFFSIFIHPNCEMDLSFKKIVMSKREEYINSILEKVFDYLGENKNVGDIVNSTDFNNDFFYNPLLAINVHNTGEFEKMIIILENKICNLPNGFDAFTFQFIEKIRYIIIDMMISLSLGYKEHVVAAFKSLIEEYSIFFEIGSTSVNDFNYIKKAYCLFTRVQFKKFISDKKFFELNDELNSLYSNFYKTRYELTDYNEFYNNLKRNNLYCIDKEKKNFNKNVDNLIKTVFEGYEFEINDLKTIYNISKDMAHASGYNFNATDEMVEMIAHKVLKYSYVFLVFFISSATLTLEAHNIKTNTKNLIDLLKNMIEVHNEFIKEIHDKHKITE